ncbi:MAG: glycosyltransferase, partial [Oscillospiraceae bacterium]
MRVLVIIPAYNEQECIKKVLAEVKASDFECDYIVVNDCSKDNTKQILTEGNYNHINLPVNLGIGGGMQTGYKYARDHGYDIAVQ